MGEKRRFLKASSHYLISQIVVLSISLGSIPIVVRLLSVEDYGTLSLCNTILLFSVALSKMGMQRSIIRFYPDYENQANLPCFFRTYSLVGLILGFLFFWISGLMTHLFVPQISSLVVWFVAGVALFQTFSSYLMNFLRSREKSTLFSLMSILSKAFTSFGGIWLILLFNDGLLNLFQAQFFSVFVIVLILLLYQRHYLRGGNRLFSSSLIIESIKFGAPLVVSELSGIALAFSDRFFIAHYNGMEQLGIYTVAYTLCMYIGDLLRQPLSMAVGPMYTRIYSQKGEQQACAFLAEIGQIVALIGLPVFFGCVAIRVDLINFLASEKYESAATIIPWVLGGFLLYACQPLNTAGLYLKKKTRVIAIISAICIALNVVANFFLLPRFGIIAAAWTTAGCYILSVVLIFRFSSKQLLVQWQFIPIMKYAFVAVLMYLVVVNLPVTFDLFIKIFIGIFFYTTFVLMLDGYVRKQFKKILTERIS